MQVRVKGRRQGNVCGPDEVNLVTTPRGETVVGTPIGRGKSSYGTHQPESQPAIFTGCASHAAGRPASPLWTLVVYYMWACTRTTLPLGSWSRTRGTGTVYISGASQGWRKWTPKRGPFLLGAMRAAL